MDISAGVGCLSAQRFFSEWEYDSRTAAFRREGIGGWAGLTTRVLGEANRRHEDVGTRFEVRVALAGDR